MQQEISILQLIMNASIVVQAIIALLLLFSVVSWAIIFGKWLSLSLAKNKTNSFLRQFHNSNSISNLYSSLSGKENKLCVEDLFFNGINEYNKLSKQGITQKDVVLDNIDRSLSASIESQIDKFEHNLSILATFGSVSPYIGLLGTVWGIMHAFIGLGASGQATLATVAPGIAEALVATAIGLFVAIPAYIAFNKFTADISSLNNKMNKFGDEFLNLINRRLTSTVASNSDNM
ncbi:MAG: tolQ [Burkholderiales bacterium]|nr:tolQ [Burkholderiales bacterium]